MGTLVGHVIVFVFVSDCVSICHVFANKIELIIILDKKDMINFHNMRLTNFD